MPATLGQLIRERRMEMNLTQEELAERVGEGVRQSEISRLERNRVTLPRRHRMEELAVALDIPVGLLLARSGWAGAEALDDELPGPGAAETGRDETGIENPGRLDLAAREPGPDDGTAADPVNQGPSHDAGVASDDPAILQAEAYFLDDEYDDDRQNDGAWGEDASQSLRETVARTESLIAQSRSRVDNAKSTMERGRRSVIRDAETGPN